MISFPFTPQPSAKRAPSPNTGGSCILPVIGARRIVDVRRADVARLHAGLVRTPYEANRTLAVVSAVWNWAARRDEVAADGNPAKAIERYPGQGRERFLTSEEFARLGDTLRLAETTGLPWQVDETKPTARHAPNAGNRLRTLDPFAVAAIRLLILTGGRLREILDAQWLQDARGQAENHARGNVWFAECWRRSMMVKGLRSQRGLRTG
jgi:integrase